VCGVAARADIKAAEMCPEILRNITGEGDYRR
jgi:hypothetical protein